MSPLEGTRKRCTAMIFAALLMFTTGCVGYLDLENEQDYFTQPVGEIYGSRSVGQSFVSHYAGLNRVEMLLATYRRRNSGPITFHLKESPSSDEDLITIEVDAAEIEDNAFHRFSFDPLYDSKGRSYFFSIDAPHSAPGNAITIWHSPYDVYSEGRWYIDGQAKEGDLAFKTYYCYDLKAIAGDLYRGLKYGMESILLSMFLFLLPGYAVLLLLSPEFSLVQRLIASPGVSLALFPLILLFYTLTGVRVDRLQLNVLMLGFGGIILGGTIDRIRRGTNIKTLLSGMDPWYHALLLIFAISLTVRLLIVRDLSFPLWTDSYHHTLISQLIAERGQVPHSLRPYVSIDRFTYHFGFHSPVAAFHWLSGIEISRSVVLIGQVINALSCLSIYLLVEKLLRDRKAALIAALIVGLLAPVPAYYVNWGRYTQLAGQAILPLALVFTLEGIERKDRKLRCLLVGGITVAGLFLTHYQVLIFYVCFVLIYLVHQTYTHRDDREKVLRLWSRAGAIGLLAAALTLPWLWNVCVNLPRFRDATGRATRWDYGDFFAFSFTDLIAYGLSPSLMATSLLGGVLGFVKKERFIIIVTLWTITLFLLANLYPLGIGLLYNTMVIIALYLPGSILSGYCLSHLADAAYARLVDFVSPTSAKVRGIMVRLLFGALFLAASLWGARNVLAILEPSNGFVRRSDERAMAWIRENTPLDAKFLVNTHFWLPMAVEGRDAGYWIPLLSGRETTLPPHMMYHDDTHLDYALAVNALAKATMEMECPEGALPILKDNGMTHVYIGQRGGNIRPERLLNRPNYQLVYHHDGVWIFEIDYDVKAKE